MLLEFLRSWSPKAEPVPALRQSGALPYTIVNDRLVFLLVTSRKTGRWIFPKGSISAGMTPWDSAAKEALEEAGVSGEIDTNPIGTYYNSDKDMRVEIDLYPLRVEAQLEAWQEMDQRLRHWALLTETKRLLSDRTLSNIAETLHRQLTARRLMQ